jgi:hypothetical protein
VHAKTTESSAHSRPPKVLPIEEEKCRLIARDEKAHRMIVGIGSHGSPLTSSWASAYYNQQRAKGKSRNTAVRALAFK